MIDAAWTEAAKAVAIARIPILPNVLGSNFT
jgi:hypothetical protein